ncbi:hypothetical protein B0H15DRAFT_806774 [Mycena belliarum]|uniref:Uncharacterized protein n=1 Tax=Mycena belliarum TaxID=1033014 RepID=A0AAD6XIL8_9AGAR|nr:hypothetical protein B0H15DRAFT_806774 [Mycena belliae]
MVGALSSPPSSPRPPLPTARFSQPIPTSASDSHCGHMRAKNGADSEWAGEDPLTQRWRWRGDRVGPHGEAREPGPSLSCTSSGVRRLSGGLQGGNGSWKTRRRRPTQRPSQQLRAAAYNADTAHQHLPVASAPAAAHAWRIFASLEHRRRPVRTTYLSTTSPLRQSHAQRAAPDCKQRRRESSRPPLPPPLRSNAAAAQCNSQILMCCNKLTRSARTLKLFRVNSRQCAPLCVNARQQRVNTASDRADTAITASTI